MLRGEGRLRQRCQPGAGRTLRAAQVSVAPRPGAAGRVSPADELRWLSLPLSGQGGDLGPLGVPALSSKPLWRLSGGTGSTCTAEPFGVQPPSGSWGRGAPSHMLGPGLQLRSLCG